MPLRKPWCIFIVVLYIEKGKEPEINSSITTVINNKIRSYNHVAVVFQGLVDADDKLKTWEIFSLIAKFNQELSKLAYYSKVSMSDSSFIRQDIKQTLIQLQAYHNQMLEITLRSGR